MGGPHILSGVDARKDTVLGFESAAAWEVWLAENHASASGLWLRIGKKAAEQPSVTYAEALDVALCYGWIDGQKDRLDDSAWLQRFTPRGPRSKWSRINTEHATRLIAEGRMRPAGLREVEGAKADGRWAAAYEGQRTIEVPEDLQQALAGNPMAAKAFEGLSRSLRYAILNRVQDAKRPETRARRIAQFVDVLADGTAAERIRRGQMSDPRQEILRSTLRMT